MLVAMSLWELLWKSFALWKAAQKNQKYWYVAILVLNTIGIVPIAYLIIDKVKQSKIETIE